MAGGAGITLNGAATAPIYNIVDWLLDLHRNISSVSVVADVENQNMATAI